MDQDFSGVMAKHSNEELVKITTIQRENFKPAAIEAAEKELTSRKIDPAWIEEVKKELIEKASEQRKFDSSIVDSGTRLVHFFIDLIIFSILGLILSIIIDLFMPTSGQGTMSILSPGIFLIAFFLYFVFMEHRYQKTIGKFLTKTRVVMSDGTQPKLNDILMRTICRLIPLDRVSYLFTKNGFHDRFSNTTVVKEEDERKL